MRNRLSTFLGLLIVIFITSCSKDDNAISEFELSEYEIDVVNYFQEVALGFEFGSASEVTRKWNTEMKIYVGGNPSTTLVSELESIINEINSLITDGVKISIVDSENQSNFFVFFGSGDDYASLYSDQATFVDSNWGLFSVFWDNNQFNSGHMYIDIFRANDAEQKHLLREELTQSLGLARDSFKYSESIFQSEWTRTTEYAPIDRDLIRLLYHPKMSVGLNTDLVDPLLRDILLNE